VFQRHVGERAVYEGTVQHHVGCLDRKLEECAILDLDPDGHTTGNHATPRT
jgi:hypothetical protein